MATKVVRTRKEVEISLEKEVFKIITEISKSGYSGVRELSYQYGDYGHVYQIPLELIFSVVSSNEIDCWGHELSEALVNLQSKGKIRFLFDADFLCYKKTYVLLPIKKEKD